MRLIIAPVLLSLLAAPNCHGVWLVDLQQNTTAVDVPLVAVLQVTLPKWTQRPGESAMYDATSGGAGLYSLSGDWGSAVLFYGQYDMANFSDFDSDFANYELESATNDVATFTYRPELVHAAIDNISGIHFSTISCPVLAVCGWDFGSPYWIEEVTPPTLEDGDLNGDGGIDAADAGIMFGNWTGDSSIVVPEPTNWRWFVFGLLFAGAIVSKRDIGKAGLFSVASQLSRQGAVINEVSVGKVDELVCGGIRIKTRTSQHESWQDTIDKDFSRWEFVVLVKLGPPHRFFIIPANRYAKLVADQHQEHLDRHSGVRPKNPDSNHCQIREEVVREYENRWDLFLSSSGSD